MVKTKQILTKAMVQKLKTQNDMILLITPVFIVLGRHWRPGKRWPCSCLTTALLLTAFHQNNLDAERILWLAAVLELTGMCSKVWMPKTAQRAPSLHLRDPNGLHWKVPVHCWWGHCSSWSLVFHFKFPIWSNAYISYNFIYVLIILIYRIKIQNFLSDHSSISHTSED